MKMRNSLRCCLACVLRCGALDLIRIDHLNGYVEEIHRPVTAGEILKENPNHVLSKPSSQGVVWRILILSLDSELKRGSIYFLIPESSFPENKKINSSTISGSTTASDHRRKSSKKTRRKLIAGNIEDYFSLDVVPVHPKKSKSKSKSSRRDRRCGRVAVWRPHLESITEDS